MEVAGIEITHPERIVFPELGLTKFDVARYYARVAPLMLPHVGGRPLSLVRCPAGSGAQCFFQKHWVGDVPESIDTVMIRQSDGKRHPYVVVHDAGGLVTLAQWGVMEIHLWGARADNPDAPDRMVFDLDPGAGVTWPAMREAARLVHGLLDELGLQSWIKSSGGKGLHVVVPLNRRNDWEEVKTFSHDVAELLAREFPDRLVASASKALRPGRIYLDWLRNARGASWVAPWSLRARAEAGVSLPFAWAGLSRVRAADTTSLATLKRLPAADPWSAMLKSRQTLTRTMHKRVAAA